MVVASFFGSLKCLLLKSIWWLFVAVIFFALSMSLVFQFTSLTPVGAVFGFEVRASTLVGSSKVVWRVKFLSTVRESCVKCT